MGKRVKLVKAYVVMGVTVPADVVGEIVAYPGRDQSPMASQPDQELGVVKIHVLKPASMTFGIPIDKLKDWVVDVPEDTVLTPP